MKTITFIATTVILFASVLSVAKAALPSDLPTAVVKFGDLDATYPAGQEELYRPFEPGGANGMQPAAGGTWFDCGGQVPLHGLHRPG
jgi:hypothetical protein